MNDQLHDEHHDDGDAEQDPGVAHLRLGGLRLPEAGPGDQDVFGDLGELPDLSYRDYRWRKDRTPPLPHAG